MSDGAAMRARDLTKRYTQLVAVKNLDLDIPTGTVYGFLGAQQCRQSDHNPLVVVFVATSVGSEYGRVTWKAILPRYGSRTAFLLSK